MPFSLKVQKMIKAPVKKVFEAFSDAKLLSTWFTTKHRHNFRPGGKYRNGDGDEGKYIEIKPGRYLSFTWDNKMHCPGTEVRIKFTGLGRKKSKIILTHLNLQSEAHVKGMKTGWSWAAACLKLFLETGRRIGYNEWYKAKYG